MKQIQPWTKTPKPSYLPGQAPSKGMIIFEEEFPIEKWIPLDYTSEVLLNWLKE
ncbi:MAG: hypothetical protein HC908_16670 [Calothrix sp. SM1_7_51]|nr:hypothetical protein [Calothrix sp. SM1_7_51]